MTATWNAAELADQKNLLRRQAYDARNAQPDKETVSAQAMARFLALPEYQHAQTVMWYLDCRSELRTRHHVAQALGSSQRIVVPYCTVDEHGENKLGLWWLQSIDELVVGKWKILEPPQDRWQEPGKVIEPQELDLVMVPGVAFDRQGARMGNGQGYYDRLLRQVRPDCALIGLCYECQLFPQLVVGPHDIPVRRVVTEAGIYP